MRQLRSWFVLTLTIAFVATGLLFQRLHRMKLNARKYIDDAGLVASDWADQQGHYLEEVMKESGVDVRVRLVPSTRGQPLPAFALHLMREQGIGREVGGRGLLIVVDDSTKQSRIEVGPHLEGVFPDGFVAYLLRDHLGAVFDSAGAARAIWTTLLIIHNRIREARLGGEFDPRVLTYLQDVRSLARGGGASVPIPRADRLRRLLDQPTDSAIAAYFAPQPSVEEAYQRHLELLALGLWPRYVPLFRPSSRGILEVQQPNSRGWNDYILMTRYGYSYEIDQRGDDAMLYYTGTPFQSPLFFRRGPDGWQMDIVAEFRNSQEVIGGYYTWRLRRGRDRSGAVFADRYEQINGTDFGEFFRVRGGDNRPLCIYGEPTKRLARREHRTMCLADSLWRSDSP